MICRLAKDQKLLNSILNMQLLKSGDFLITTLIMLLKEFLLFTLEDIFLTISK